MSNHWLMDKQTETYTCTIAFSSNTSGLNKNASCINHAIVMFLPATSIPLKCYMYAT